MFPVRNIVLRHSPYCKKYFKLYLQIVDKGKLFWCWFDSFLFAKLFCHEAILNHSYGRMPMIAFEFINYLSRIWQPVWSQHEEKERKGIQLWTFPFLSIFNDYARESDRPTQFFFCTKVCYIHYKRGLCVSNVGKWTMSSINFSSCL